MPRTAALVTAAICSACGRIGFDGIGAVDDGMIASTYRSELRLDRVAAGEMLVDFPLLVVLDDSRAARGAMQSDASDLMFLTSDGTQLAQDRQAYPRDQRFTARGADLLDLVSGTGRANAGLAGNGRGLDDRLADHLRPDRATLTP